MHANFVQQLTSFCFQFHAHAFYLHLCIHSELSLYLSQSAFSSCKFMISVLIFALCFQVLCVSWTAKTNERVLNKAGVNRELLDTVNLRKLAHCHNARCTRRRGTPRTALINNINTWIAYNSPWKSQSE